MPIDDATTRFVGVDFTNADWTDAVARIVAAADLATFTTVITPNVDHIVRLDQLGDTPLGRRYHAAIADADYCFCDSRVLAKLAQLRRIKLHVVPGSDLTAAIFADHLSAGENVAIVGGDADTIADLAAAYPQIKVSQHIPPMGMVHNPTAMDAAARFICGSQARFIFIAVGNPQGELLAHRARELGAKRGVALSIGASIDFLTGRRLRAPAVVRKIGFEWAFRLATEPKRLWRRYLVDGPRIFAIVMRKGDR